MSTETDRSDSAGQPTQRASSWLIGLVFGAVALRIILMLFRSTDLLSDPDAYVAHARTLAEVGTYCAPDSDRPTAYRPPLYPFLLAGLKTAGFNWEVAVACINLACSAIIMIAVWWTARLMGLRGKWPGVSAAAVGFDPLLLRYTLLPMTEVITGAFLSVAMLQSLKLLKQRAGSVEPLPSPVRTAVIAGVCFGLGGLCRPVVLVTCLVVTFVLAIWSVRLNRLHSQSGFEFRRVGLKLLPAVVTGLILVPWIVRNAIQFQQFIPATTHGGYTLLLGNNPIFYDEVVNADQGQWSGDSLRKWQNQIRRQLISDGVNPADESASDRWHYARAIANIRVSGIDFANACLLRWKRFWSLRPSTGQMPQLFSLASFVWYAIVFTGLFSCFLMSANRRRSDIQLLSWAILSFLMLHSFYWTNARMRAPLTGAIVILSVIGWQFWLNRPQKTD